MSKVSLSVRVDAGVIEHNNREFFAKNVNPEKVKDNIIYKQENLREVYQKLFGEALEKYNASKTKTRDKITDYYEHISRTNKEKLFYEAIIQFGDKDTHAVGSSDGENAKKMLDEYMKEFEKRNPNLYVFNAVMHMDEATPHIHIDFVPVAKNQKRGLETRVSLKGALSQQGVEAKSIKYSERQQWAAKEKIIMAQIAKAHGYEVISKGIHRPHLSVDEYKNAMDEMKSLEKRIQDLQRDDGESFSREDIALLKNQLREVKKKLQVADEKANAPIVEVEIPNDEKTEAVRKALDDNRIKFAETAHGFSVPKYAESLINETLKNFKPQKNFMSFRDRLALDIDEGIYFSDSFDGLLKNLQNKGYEIKRGKYVAVRPKNAERFMRLKSLGEDYTENALKVRIENRDNFYNACREKIAATSGIEKDFNVAVGQVTALVYDRKLRPRKANRYAPYTFKNDYRINRLLECARLISEDGITADNVKSKIEAVQNRNAELFKLIREAENAQAVRSELINRGEKYFSGGDASAETAKLMADYEIQGMSDVENLRGIYAEKESELAELRAEIAGNKEKLASYHKIEEIADELKYGSYIDKLVHEELERLRNEAEVQKD